LLWEESNEGVAACHVRPGVHPIIQLLSYVLVGDTWGWS
jgi:hypothetical protein